VTAASPGGAGGARPGSPLSAGHREQAPGTPRPADAVRPAIGERDAGPDHQVLHRPGDEDLGGPGQARQVLGHVHAHARHLGAEDLHLAGVDAGPDLDAEIRGGAACRDAAMSERTAAFAPSVAETCGFADIRTVADVGGGQGTLLVEILRRHPHLQGIVFDVPTVAARAEAVLEAADLRDRCEVLAGDFFAAVPPGADCYLLANVLHDWDDARAAEILGNCRRALARGGRVLIVERLIPGDPGQAVPTLLSDINMLVITGGQERTDAEYGALLAAAGLRLTAVRPVAFPYGVIEGVPAQK
jgi:SAM-dependent methyltransferase